MQEDQIYSPQDQSLALPRTFISSVFGWMFLALAITAAMAFFTATSPQLLGLMYTETGLSIFGYVIIFAPLVLVLIMSSRFNKLSGTALASMLIVYSVLLGMSLSFILLVYTSASIFKTFAITAGTFGVMAVLGYTTKTDLTKLGSLLFMGLIGVILAMVVNFFLKSARLDYIVSVIGVIVFTGLTAYDMQKLKKIGYSVEQGSETFRKMAIMGALSLYLDFINLFLFLLRIFGSRK